MKATRRWWLWPSLAIIAGVAGVVYLLANQMPNKRTSQNEEPRDAAALRRVGPGLKADLAKKGLRFGAPVFLRVFKESKELEIWVESKPGEKFEFFKTYQIAFFSGRLGPKLREGDRQAPEGFYFVGLSQMNPRSQFHLSFNIGYPNAYDQFHGRTGGLIMVHGNTVSVGCFAMTDERIEEIYTLANAALQGGQRFFRVHCFPFRMTAERMAQAETDQSEWLEFWRNLKAGHDWFEERRRPPNVNVKDGVYVFDE